MIFIEKTVSQYSDDEFFQHFRVSRNVVQEITDRYENSDFYKHKIGQFGSISAYNQVTITSFTLLCGIIL